MSFSSGQLAPEDSVSPSSLANTSLNAARKSIRSPSDSAPPPLDMEEDTFHQLLSIHVDQPVGSMSISECRQNRSTHFQRLTTDRSARSQVRRIAMSLCRSNQLL